MKTQSFIVVLCLLPFLSFSQQPFVRGILYQGTNEVGAFRQICKDKKEALDLIVKYTNSIAGIAKGCSVVGIYHTCYHDSVPITPCLDELLTGKIPVLSPFPSTNFCVEVRQLTTAKDKQSIQDNPPFFRIPATKGTAITEIQKIVAEEFVGKQVTTNATDVSSVEK